MRLVSALNTFIPKDISVHVLFVSLDLIQSHIIKVVIVFNALLRIYNVGRYRTRLILQYSKPVCCVKLGLNRMVYRVSFSEVKNDAIVT
jgi:hypothetical protein